MRFLRKSVRLVVFHRLLRVSDQYLCVVVNDVISSNCISFIFTFKLIDFNFTTTKCNIVDSTKS